MAYHQHPASNRHAPFTNIRLAYPSVNTTTYSYPSHDANYHASGIPPMQQQQLPPAHVLQYLSPPLSQQPSPISFPNSYAHPAYATNPSRHSTQSSPYSRPSAAPHHQPPARAVIIGINYFAQKGELKTPCRDARNLFTYLTQIKRYTPENIILLTDDQNGAYGQPTRKNILDALSWIGETAGRTHARERDSGRRAGRDRDSRPMHPQAQEKVVIYYSGHGKVAAMNKHPKPTSKNSKSSSRHSHSHTDSHHASQNDNVDGEEAESSLETIYPVDFRSFPRGMITPEEMEETLRPAMRRGVKMTVIFDACAAVS